MCVATLRRAVSTVRLVIGPPLLISAVVQRRLGLVAVILAACLASGWIDGCLPRDEIGKSLDRMADRTVPVALAGSLLFIDVGPDVLLALALVREVVVGLSTIALTFVHVRPAPVSYVGKLGFALLSTGLVAYLLAEANLSWLPRHGSLGSALHSMAILLASLGLAARYFSAWRSSAPAS